MKLCALRSLFVAAVVLMWVSRLPAQDQSTVIFDMDTIRFKPMEVEQKDKTKGPVGEVAAEDGKVGKAVKFTFKEGLKGFTSLQGALKASPEWDTAAGISMWVKGDGSKNVGVIQLIDPSDSSYSLRYDATFPLSSTEWTKVNIPWRDFIPVKNGKLVDAKAGQAPSKFGAMWFGKWWYWRDLPAVSFSIDQIALEKTIELDNTDYTPKGDGLARVKEKIAKKQPITIVTMGDSLSDKRHWANRQTLWSELLVKDIRFKSDTEAKLVNPAIGGTGLNQNMVMMPLWVRDTPSPDLVTIWFGYNDWDNGVRGETFKDYLRLAVDRARRMTKGSADVMLLTTNPAFARWETMKEMEQAARDVAAEKKCGLVDVAEAVRKLGSADEALKADIWTSQNNDKTHLGAAGHKLVGELVYKAMTESK